MIAKLVTHAGDRLSAIDAQATALDAFVIDGIRHNIPFLSALMQHQRWRDGKLSTGFIAEEFPDGFLAARRRGRDRSADHRGGRRACRSRPERAQARDFRPVSRRSGACTFDLKRAVMLGTARIDVEVAPSDGGVDVVVRRRPPAARRYRVDAGRAGVARRRSTSKPIAVQVRADPQRFCARPSRRRCRGARLYASRGGARRLDDRARRRRSVEDAALPDAGLVKAIAVKEGQQVRPGDPLCVVEAMKMENQLVGRARRDGEEDRRQGRRFARGRRGDHGIRVAPHPAVRSALAAAGPWRERFIATSRVLRHPRSSSAKPRDCPGAFPLRPS